jgi:hypothetical protein
MNKLEKLPQLEFNYENFLKLSEPQKDVLNAYINY